MDEISVDHLLTTTRCTYWDTWSHTSARDDADHAG